METAAPETGRAPEDTEKGRPNPSLKVTARAKGPAENRAAQANTGERAHTEAARIKRMPIGRTDILRIKPATAKVLRSPSAKAAATGGPRRAEPDMKQKELKAADIKSRTKALTARRKTGKTRGKEISTKEVLPVREGTTLIPRARKAATKNLIKATTARPRTGKTPASEILIKAALQTGEETTFTQRTPERKAV